MNKILLIDRLNPHNNSEEKHEVFFMLGGMNDPDEEDKIMDTIRGSGIINSEDIILKYNGVELNIAVQQIPKITKYLIDAGILVYGIYQIYSPYEDIL